MKFTAKPNVSPSTAYTAAARQYLKDVRTAAINATDRASREARQGVQERIRSTGLGKLGNAVGQTSTKREGNTGDPYGVIFAKGGDQSLAGGALESYSRGATIRPGADKQWLAYPTKAIPRFVSVGGQRRRLTPELYMRSGLVASLGPLEFRPLSDREAIWVIKKVSISPKTGRAAKLGPGRTRTRVPVKEVVAFVGIRVTRRAARFDKDGVVGFYARRVPSYMQEELDAIRSRRA